jgi:hypothetical protein
VCVRALPEKLCKVLKRSNSEGLLRPLGVGMWGGSKTSPSLPSWPVSVNTPNQTKSGSFKRASVSVPGCDAMADAAGVAAAATRPPIPSLPMSPRKPGKRSTTTTTQLNLREYGFLSPREPPPLHAWDDADPLKLDGTLQPPVPRCR